MLADIFLIIMLEASETSRMKQDKNNHYFRIAHTVRLIPVLAVLVFNHIFFLLQCKFLAQIICHTINFRNFKFWEHSGNRLNSIIRHYKFNTFIAICLLFNEIFINLGSHIQKNIFIIVLLLNLPTFLITYLYKNFIL